MGATTSGKRPATRSVRRRSNTFRQRLGSLTYYQACRLLGDNGAELMQEGDQLFEIQSDRDVFLGGDLFRVRVEDSEVPGGYAVATFTLNSTRTKQLQVNCDHCETNCHHLGAALAYLLDAKTELDLAMPPDDSVPLENLTTEELKARALAERARRAAEEPMRVRTMDTNRPWTDYVVTSERSGRSYRVALRGMDEGQSFCTCPDFRTNHLGICKHILQVQAKVNKRFSQARLRAPYRRKTLSLGLRYRSFDGTQPSGFIFHLPHRADAKTTEFVGSADQVPITDAADVMARLQALEAAGIDVRIFPDAEACIQRELVQRRLREEAHRIRQDVAGHPLRTQLLNATLLPYQLDGIAFAVGAGRAILADDMGLGKTIQAIGVAELLAQLAEIQRVLVICPASLKSQWRAEIARFCDRSCQIVLGSGEQRAIQYAGETFFTICNYEQILRDLTAVEDISWDLIILDEGQRIKNWESKTSNVIRQLDSPFRLVLSGTPLENRLGELFTVTKFIDDNLLGPAFRFFHAHHVVDERGKTLGYRRLDELRETLRPVLLRRTRAEVASQLPERTDEVIRCEATAEQLEVHDANMRVVAQIAGKKFLTEMDRLRLQKCLLLARMACDSTFLIDRKEPEYSSKLERLGELLEGLLEDPTRRIIVFSEWRRMLDRIELRLDTLECEYVRLDGQVPQKKRSALIARFQNDANCRVITMTNAGSTGLNLQTANTVINVDLPWNPAVLEQRIARAYRMGQKRPVHIYKLVTTGDTVEEGLLTTLAAKQNLADASLNFDSDLSEIQMVGGMEDLKRRLEVILNPLPAAKIDASQKRRVEWETEQLTRARRLESVSAASGQLVTAALSLAGELIADGATTPSEETVNRLTEKLTDCIERDADGRPQLTIKLPDDDALRGLARSLAKLIGGA